MAPRPKAWVCGRSNAGIVGSNPAWSMDGCLLCVLFVVQRIYTGCGFSEHDADASKM